ncbi:MAG: ATP-binding protein [Mucilaginibacter sp.]|jgi:hypothetical protein|uniref:HD domain-containing protein n=1 Tax=Mucilaginibacter sp. TaxID=1882438 RepID=UPI00356AF2EE
MISDLTTAAEQSAEKAESLKAFSGLKLLHVKKQVELILAQIGRNGIFDEYTKHDISHIDSMLISLDEIIPENTKKLMTPADWMMITLAIYFHDLGMLVTKDEFAKRNYSGFVEFYQSIRDGILGSDFRDKVQNIEPQGERERFIYQEFVRRTHAERIKFWILDEYDLKFPDQPVIVKEIKKLIENIDPLFRRDLAIVCESHHLSDLEDLAKYKPDQQYGPSKNEVVNVQYAALLLRTADLLHITSDRTPSIEYSLINPTDPISQEEWAKQASVKAVRPQNKKNKEGNIDSSLAKDTFEIIALFEEESGFFGLIAYLNYADKQLKENFRLNEIAKKSFDTKFEYPWKNIDNSQIETKDFDKRQFEFILDQNRILDLLIGHTLYNDPSVVLRELTQNAIDASKLMKYEDEQDNIIGYEPEITIEWNENSRELSFIDNGTGMTLDIIQNHLLKVGSSRYQDENFKKQYPDFSSISRFGIGLLTCFLIADDIDIITNVKDQDKGILLKIKKVHGKYLLKYLNNDKLPISIKKHGTIVKLFVRSDVDLNEIESELKKWILIPNCKLTLQNNGVVKQIGSNSLTNLLKSHLEQTGINVDNKEIKINEVEVEGVRMAYALRFVEHWQEWVFLEYQESRNKLESPVGICIEGIRVDFNTPGFIGRNFYAVVDASGKNAPKTNVARSNIEVTPEKQQLLQRIYQLYFAHITNQLQSLRQAGFSITWAASEANWILNSLSGPGRRSKETQIEDVSSFEMSLSTVKCILIEQSEKRDVISIEDLKAIDHFWTIDCASYTSADSLLKEIKSSNTSALSLLNNIFDVADSNTKHIDNLLCNFNSNSVIDKIISENFQVSSIKIIPEQRRLDLKWSLAKSKVWEEIKVDPDEHSYSNLTKCYLQLEGIDMDESITQTAIHSKNVLFILLNSELNKFLVKVVNDLSGKTVEDAYALSKIIGLINNLFHYKNIEMINLEEYFENRLMGTGNKRDISELVWKRINKSELISAITNTSFIKYDTTIWHRRDLFL